MNKPSKYNLSNRTPHDVNFSNGTSLPQEKHDGFPPLRAQRVDHQIGQISIRESRRSQLEIPVYEVDLGELEETETLHQQIDELQERQRKLANGTLDIIVASRWAVRAADLSGFSIDPSKQDVGLGFPVQIKRDKRGTPLHAGGVGVPQPGNYQVVNPQKIKTRRTETFFSDISQLSLRTPEAAWQFGNGKPLQRKGPIAEPLFKHNAIGTSIKGVNIYQSYPQHVENQTEIDPDTLVVDHSEAIIADMLTRSVDERKIDELARKAFVWKPDRLASGKQSNRGKGLGFFSPRTWERIRKLGY